MTKQKTKWVKQGMPECSIWKDVVCWAWESIWASSALKEGGQKSFRLATRPKCPEQKEHRQRQERHVFELEPAQ